MLKIWRSAYCIMITQQEPPLMLSRSVASDPWNRARSAAQEKSIVGYEFHAVPMICTRDLSKLRLLLRYVEDREQNRFSCALCTLVFLQM